MSFGALKFKEEVKLGRLYSVPYNSIPAVNVFEFKQPLEALGRRDRLVAFRWDGALTPKNVRRWLEGLNEIVTGDADCKLEIWGDDYRFERLYRAPDYKGLEAKLRGVSFPAHVALLPQTTRHNLYVDGHLKQDGAATTLFPPYYSPGSKPHTGIRVAIDDLLSVNGRMLITKLLTDTIDDVRIAPQRTGALFHAVQGVLRPHYH